MNDFARGSVMVSPKGHAMRGCSTSLLGVGISVAATTWYPNFSSVVSSDTAEGGSDYARAVERRRE
jgi:hypothetical protein